MLPHPPHKRILSRVVFYLGVLVIALILRITAPDPTAGLTSPGLSAADALAVEAETARAYFAYPNSQ